jgi:hypothetical protein
MPLGVSKLLAESFEARGVKVLRPKDTDADDVLAALAHKHDGVVLSRDADFYRYVPKIRVVRGYSIDHGRLVLDENAWKRDDLRASPIGIDPELANPITHRAWVHAFPAESMYRRGASSSSDRQCGSLHVLSRPLLAAVLHTKGARSVVEEIPEWDATTGSVRWNTVVVRADSSQADTLSDVATMVRWLAERDSPVDRGWRGMERNFNRHVVAASMHATAFGGPITPLLRQPTRSDCARW